MTIKGIGSQNFLEQAIKAKQTEKKGDSSFDNSLADHLHREMETDSESVQSNGIEGSTRTRTVLEENVLGNTLLERLSNAKKTGDLQNTQSEELTDADYSNVNILKRYSLKAKVLSEDGSKVYVEQKNEDGTVNHYRIDLSRISQDTEDPIEQAALQAWNKKNETTENADEELTTEQALLQFYEFIEDRIKNGPPEILTGGNAFSVKDWDRLLEKIDGNLDEIKEELEERIEKLKQEAKEQEQIETAQVGSENKDALADTLAEFISQRQNWLELAGVEDTEKNAEKDTEENTEENATAGNTESIAKNDRTGGSIVSSVTAETENTPGYKGMIYHKNDKSAPYSYLADESGMVTYNGVVFQCDNENRRLTLGDVSNPKNCLRIPLSGGGSLMVNTDNLGDLAGAIGMFSPEDVNLILRAMAQDAKIQQMQKEIDDDTNSIGEAGESAKDTATVETTTEEVTAGEAEKESEADIRTADSQITDEMIQRLVEA
ncbi:MAG: hypothetical protein PHP50_04710 [Lachnospiraceae bacterium]|nr:hypothetical protein [Lachnospiraceae bacterium]